MISLSECVDITLPIFILFIIAEIIISGKQRQQKYQVKDTWISIWFAILGGIFDIAMRGVCFLVLDFFNKHAIIETDFLIYNPLLGWILVFVAQDFYFYWLHRSEHSIRVLWAVHSLHQKKNDCCSIGRHSLTTRNPRDIAVQTGMINPNAIS